MLVTQNYTKILLEQYPERGVVGRQVVALNMFGSIQTIFIIWSGLVACSLCSFGWSGFTGI